jgi:glycolate oxidase FAD binding subunit
VSHATLSLASRLGDLVGPGRVLTDATSLTTYEVDGCRPLAALLPESAAEVAEILRFASAERLAAIPVGGKTHLHIGMPPHRYDIAIDVSGINRVLAYEPRDLTLAVEPGITFSDIECRLKEKRQFVPLSAADERATIGGIVAAAADAPFRYAHGTAKDFLLGLEFVTGEGVTAKSGGSVVKNVTGYELHKLFIGSLGTLGVITRLNFRTFPLPAGHRMFIAIFDQHSDAVAFCRGVMKSPLHPKILDVINPEAAALFAEHRANFLNRRSWVVIVEAGGQETALQRHAQDLAAISRDLRAREFLGLPEGLRDQLFACLCQFSGTAFGKTSAATVFRIAALPTALPELLEQTRTITDRHQLACAILIRAYRIVYIALLPENHVSLYPKLVSCSRELMDLCLRSSATAMIERCPLEIKGALNIWPAPGSELELAQRLKRVFDPHSILSPGRYRGGI